MSYDWQSKTGANQGMSFGLGKGTARGWGTVVPGIEPRNFRDHIIRIRYPLFEQYANKDFAVMLKRMGWI